MIAWATLIPNGNALNTVAGLITEFFLCTYGMLNMAAFMEAISGNPSFRPRFRFFHWSTALAGALGCLGVALVINPVMAVIAVSVLAVLIWYMKKRNLQQRFGDVWWGYLFNKIRNSLLRINSLETSPKNWRPSCLIFCGAPDTRENLIQFGLWLENGRGVIYLAHVLVGDHETYFPRRQGAVERLESFCQERGLPAFPIVTVDDNLGQGMAGIMQTVSSGALRPNLLIIGFEQELGMGQVPTEIYHLARDLAMSICLIRPGEVSTGSRKHRIDIWWRGMKNGRLMLLLAYLLRNNWAWHDAEVRLLRMIPEEAGQEQTEHDLKALLDVARVEGSVEVFVSQLPYIQVLQEQSKESDVIFLGMNLPEKDTIDSWRAGHSALLCNDVSTFIFVESEGDEGLFS